MVQSAILNMFARSPIKPLQKHMEHAAKCADLLIPFFTAVLSQDWTEAETIRQQITKHEHQADEIKMDFRLHLPKNLFLPVHRMDLLDLLAKQELIANKSKDIAGIVIGRHMQFPQPITALFTKYLQRCVDASQKAHEIINELDELQESGFRGKEVDFVDTLMVELYKIEHDTDEMQIDLRQTLFDIEAELQAVDVIFLYKIIEKVGELADCSLKAGQRLRILAQS